MGGLCLKGHSGRLWWIGARRTGIKKAVQKVGTCAVRDDLQENASPTHTTLSKKGEDRDYAWVFTRR